MAPSVECSAEPLHSESSPGLLPRPREHARAEVVRTSTDLVEFPAGLPHQPRCALEVPVTRIGRGNPLECMRHVRPETELLETFTSFLEEASRRLVLA